jgi:hypothetical protein
MDKQLEFRWLKRKLEVYGQANPVLQMRTISSGTGEVYGPWENATPWVDVPTVTEEDAARSESSEATSGVFEAIPAVRREEDEYAKRVAFVIGAVVLAVIAILILQSWLG